MVYVIKTITIPILNILPILNTQLNYRAFCECNFKCFEKSNIWYSYALQYGITTVLFSMLVTFSLAILVQFLSNPCFIYRYSWFFTPFPPRLPPFVVAHIVRRWGGGGGGFAWVTRNCLQIFARNYYAPRFNVPTQGPIPGTNMDPCSTGERGADLHIYIVSMILRMPLQYTR